jgi:membrane peptidoglycan carboxypeptidase
MKNLIMRHGLRNILVFLFSCGILLAGVVLIWVSTFQIPSLNTIEERKVSQSTKIYDNTGKVLLYDVYENKKSTSVPFENISQYIKDAAVSIEDKTFYTNAGVRPLAILRAILIDIATFNFNQGGSTITQQVVKNSLLTGDKSLFGGPERKIKELVLSLKLTKTLGKDQILSMYLNENPYGGTIYGVEEASEAFFGKPGSGISCGDPAAADAFFAVRPVQGRARPEEEPGAESDARRREDHSGAV